MEVQGTIKKLEKTEEVSASFKKREIVVTTQEQYPQDILIQFVQDKCYVLNAYKVGQEVKIGINIRGKEWVSPKGEVKYFNTIQGWNISAVNASEKPVIEPLKEEPMDLNNDDEDLPF